MENDFLTEENQNAGENYIDAENQVEEAYSENGFKTYITKYKNSPFFWPIIIVLLVLLIIAIIFSITVNSTGKLKNINLKSPSIIYLGENNVQ